MHSIAKTRLVEGVGRNDTDYVIQPKVNGKVIYCPFYHCWHRMLTRCYSANFQSRNPTYAGCKVCNEWHSFMAFREWMQAQDWENKQLDKDMIGCGKLYSPNNCVFVSGSLNNLFTDNGARRGNCPIGASLHSKSGKYQATIRVNGKNKNLGLFTCADEAHRAWLHAKLEIANTFLANESNPRVRYAIECAIKKLQHPSF